MMKFVLLPFLESDAAHQMELDTELFRIFSSPIIRFYKIHPPAVTIGYHQSEKSVLHLLEDRSIRVVRRPTGGRAVLHDGDLTYSVLGKVARSFFGVSTLEIYYSISKGVKRGIEKLGISLDFIERPKVSTSPLCFQFSSKYELSYKGEKLTGGALLKRDGGFLFQGSILVDFPSRNYAGICDGTVNLTRISGQKVNVGKLIDSIVDGFREELGVEIEYGKWPEGWS